MWRCKAAHIFNWKMPHYFKLSPRPAGNQILLERTTAYGVMCTATYNCKSVPLFKHPKNNLGEDHEKATNAVQSF